jgi:(p)ppGpp synthase/HD superfamily hydrolase
MIKKALSFSEKAHRGHFRKYTHEPYFSHPLAVANIVKIRGGSDSMIAAALLHDVIEDTEFSVVDLIKAGFTEEIVSLVVELTNTTKDMKASRKVRKKLDMERLSGVSKDAKTVKLADVIHNSGSIMKHDPEFAKVWMVEAKALVEALKGGDEILWKKAHKIVSDYFVK